MENAGLEPDGGSTMATALMKAMKGEAVSDRQTKTALEEAVGKITTLQKSAKQAKEELAGALEKATHAVVFTAETQATIFGFSMVEGYRGGPDRMQLGKVDVRAPLGLAGLGYGLVGCFMELPGSAHALAVSNGITGSLIASLGAQAGLALAEKRGAVPAPVLVPTMQGMELGAPVRQVVLTPEPSVDGDDYDFGRQRRGGGRRGGMQSRGGGRGRGQGGDGLSFEERKARDGGQGRQKAMQRSQAMRRARIQQGGGQGGQGRGANRFRQGPQQLSSYEDEQAA
jgi:hypothetical protein